MIVRYFITIRLTHIFPLNFFSRKR
uniref:Uncharacterized protein n=1 Tax=Rhizophora mucronata TaxID=61149 RepID=A0A2P2R0J4_RHIMU